MTISLLDKYKAETGHVYLTGSQALVRLPMMQRKLDRLAGLKTAGFISGYRGSPLGIYDLALWQAREQLESHDILFQPGVNEDLAATAVWGTQQTGLVSPSSYDGVFALWYGKGPGVDRSGDPLKHGSFAGSAKHGGVLALCGDDHAARSSTVAHQSDHALIHFGMPVFNPANVQDYLDLGLAAFAMSRYSGVWAGFKCITDTVETSARVDVDLARSQFVLPTDFEMPAGGLNIQLGVLPIVAESRQFDLRLEAAKAFVRANKLDRQILGANGPQTLGIVTSGKSTLDVLEALRGLGIDQEKAALYGIAVYKLGVSWPIEPQGIRNFAERCREILVVEEKRPVIEEQLSHILYNISADRRPLLTGKRDRQGAPLLSQVGELTPADVLKAISARLATAPDLPEPLKLSLNDTNISSATAEVTTAAAGLVRAPSFCAGCPHNSSTKVPEGSIAMGGIGCHGLATWLPERRTVTLYHMGGEGAAWIGQAPFSDTDHIFQNLGDGTYFHSGLLAVRACVTADVNITYKILLNGAIAMTGGQPIEGESFDGSISAPHVAAQLHAEGVKKIAVVADDPTRHDPADFPSDITFHHRDDMDDVQKQMRDIKGVTAIIYDQACATERRRMRKRGKAADPDRRMFIMPEVCEGCGDCGVQSNCVAIEPEETNLGRKRRINQSVCNKDFSCAKGMCPSFVTVSGGTLRKAKTGTFAPDIDAQLPVPQLASIEDVYSVMIAGIGGNGVVTVGAILGMAAHIQGLGVSVLDISGLAQRNGPVTSHVRFTEANSAAHTSRIPEGTADAVVGCDLVVTVGAENLAKMAKDRTRLVFNQFVAPTAAFASNPDLDLNNRRLAAIAERKIGAEAMFGIDATAIAVSQLGDAIGANMLLVGHAWQKGLLPLSLEAIEQAIRLNGAAVDLNLAAFRLGRVAAVDPSAVSLWRDCKDGGLSAARQSVEQIIEDRAQILAAFDGPKLADRYRSLVEQAQTKEMAEMSAVGPFTEAVARGYFKSLYYKDEYEVARLFSDGRLQKRLAETFEGDVKLRFNLAPPLLSKKDAQGREIKREFGAWILPVFGLLARAKGLRGTPFDIFGWSKHRREERKLGQEYERLISTLLPKLTTETCTDLSDIAASFEQVKGYSVVKEAKLAQVREKVNAAVTKLKIG